MDQKDWVPPKLHFLQKRPTAKLRRQYSQVTKNDLIDGILTCASYVLALVFLEEFSSVFLILSYKIVSSNPIESRCTEL